MRKSQCTGEATTAGRKRKPAHSLATHNSKIPVAKSAKSMTAKDFDKILKINLTGQLICV